MIAALAGFALLILVALLFQWARPARALAMAIYWVALWAAGIAPVGLTAAMLALDVVLHAGGHAAETRRMRR